MKERFSFKLRDFNHYFKPFMARYKRDKIWNAKVTDQHNNVLLCDSVGTTWHAKVSNILDREVLAWWIEAHLIRIVVKDADDSEAKE